MHGQSAGAQDPVIDGAHRSSHLLDSPVVVVIVSEDANNIFDYGMTVDNETGISPEIPLFMIHMTEPCWILPRKKESVTVILRIKPLEDKPRRTFIP
jgi:hypothetical protein